MELQDKIALITAGAKRIGRTIALELARAGCNVALHYHTSSDDALSAADEIKRLGRRCETFRADLSEPDQISELFHAATESFGRIDILVNNAAICERTPLDSLTPEQWDRHFDLNVRAVALCMSAAAPLMTDGGAIINIADVSAESPWAGYPAYCSSKTALLALTRSGAKALAPQVRVNAVSPGLILWSEGISDKQRRKVLEHIPMKRTGRPEDIAAAVIFLARSDYITGGNIRVDGGWKMI